MRPQWALLRPRWETAQVGDTVHPPPFIPDSRVMLMVLTGVTARCAAVEFQLERHISGTVLYNDYSNCGRSNSEGCLEVQHPPNL